MTDHIQLVPDVSIGELGSGASAAFSIPSEIPSPPAKLSAKEKNVWSHVTTALHEVGLIHRTDSLLLTIIVRTFCRWVDAEEQFNAHVEANGGNYMVATPNGYEQPHQLFYVSAKLRRDLLQFLPEAALTIPSFAKIIQSRPAPEQGSLFEDPVEQHRARKASIGVRAL